MGQEEAAFRGHQELARQAVTDQEGGDELRPLPLSKHVCCASGRQHVFPQQGLRPIKDYSRPPQQQIRGFHATAPPHTPVSCSLGVRQVRRRMPAIMGGGALVALLAGCR